MKRIISWASSFFTQISLKSTATLIALGIILVTSFYLRLTSAAETEVLAPLRADAGNYFMYAYNLRHKQIYSRDAKSLQSPDNHPCPDAVRSPGYPIFISPFVNGLPNKAMIDRITLSQALLSSITVFFSFLLLRSFLPVFWAAAATLLVGLSPHLIVANSYILSETLFCFFLVLIGWLVSLFVKQRQLCHAAVIGMLIALASLVRPSLQYFPIVLSLFLVFQDGWRRGGKLSGMVILGFVLCFSPWLVRNMHTLGVTSDKTLMVNFLHHGLYPDFTYEGVKESRGFPYRYDPRASEICRDTASVLREASRRFEEEPIKHLQWFLIGKPVAFWSWNTVQGAGDAFVYPVTQSPYFKNSLFQWSHHFMHRLHRPIVILAFFGSLMVWLPLSRIRVNETILFISRFMSLLLIYYTGLHMIGAPFPRYSIPLRPFLYGLAFFPPWLLFLGARSRFKGKTDQDSPRAVVQFKAEIS